MSAVAVLILGARCPEYLTIDTYMGDVASIEGNVASIALLPTDTIGAMTLTLTNLVVGSAVRIEEQAAGTLVEYRAAAGTTEVFTVPVYTPGNAKNDLRIKVRKGTAAPKYQPFETLATASVTAQSVYVAQVADPIA